MNREREQEIKVSLYADKMFRLALDNKNKIMEKKTLEYADKWFKLHDIISFIHPKKDTIYIDIGNFELELSKDEIKYRASEYLRLKK